MWVRSHPFPCCLKRSTRVDGTNKSDICRELGLEIGMGAADTLDEPLGGILEHEWDEFSRIQFLIRYLRIIIRMYCVHCTFCSVVNFQFSSSLNGYLNQFSAQETVIKFQMTLTHRVCNGPYRRPVYLPPVTTIVNSVNMTLKGVISKKVEISFGKIHKSNIFSFSYRYYYFKYSCTYICELL